MDVKDIGFDELLGVAVKSEINSREAYEYLRDRSKNFVTSDRFDFLADEEQKHEEFIRNFYEKEFEGKEMELPEETPVPMPFIDFGDEMDEEKIIGQAMEAEIASRDFYKAVGKKAEDESKEDNVVNTLYYLSDMEQNHHDILESELSRYREFSEFDEYYPAMHQGP
ncbi:MAG: ferritin-like domain-containing protein [Thermoplasmatota archaeon]